MSSLPPLSRRMTPAGAARPPKLAVIASPPVPYRPPIWRYLRDVEGLDFKVLYASLEGAEPYSEPLFSKVVQWDVPVLEGYPWSLLPCRNFQTVNWRFKYTVPGMIRHLREGGFTHVLLPGKEYAYYYQALWAARRLGLPVLYRADSHPEKNSRLTDFLARLSRRSFYRQVSVFLCHGQGQFREYGMYGIPRDRMFFSPYCVDNSYFDAQRSKVIGMRDAIRGSHQVSPDTFLVGYSGKLYDRKNPMELIEAVARLRKGGVNLKLLMVGDGPLRAECGRLAERVAPGAVVFPGFMNQSELARAYVAMDMFVMPSRWETWGLVLNEAMVFHLPVMATSSCPSALDLIQEGRNGYCYKTGDVDALCDGILKIRNQLALGGSMGALSRQIIEGYSAEKAAQGIMQAIRATGGAI